MSRISDAIERGQREAVTHTLKSVRHHRIDVSIPPPPSEDQESFVITTPGMRTLGEIRLRPQDFQQFIAVLEDARRRIMGPGSE